MTIFNIILLSRSFDSRRHTLTRVVPCLQMSSEDSSNRVDSKNAFEGDSSYPSSPEGGQTPEISWTESSQHESTPQEREVTEGRFRPEGEPSDGQASSSD